jgi:hypothetical protein
MNYAYYLICTWLERPIDSRGNMPDITEPTFWTHRYRLVGRSDPNKARQAPIVSIF